jgi:hypothetical protein
MQGAPCLAAFARRGNCAPDIRNGTKTGIARQRRANGLHLTKSHVSQKQRDMGHPFDVLSSAQKFASAGRLLVLVFIDRLADAVLLPVNPVLLCFGQMAVVRRHILLLAVLDTGFAFL